MASALLCSSAMFRSVARAAMIQPVYGQVLINQGEGYKTVVNPIQLRQGDTIIVNPGGVANLTYPDGCSIEVNPGSVITVGAHSPCAVENQPGQQSQGGRLVQTQDVTTFPQGPVPAVEPAAAAATGGGMGTLVAIGLGIAAAGGLAFALAGSGNDDKTPASP